MGLGGLGYFAGGAAEGYKMGTDIQEKKAAGQRAQETHNEAMDKVKRQNEAWDGIYELVRKYSGNGQAPRPPMVSAPESGAPPAPAVGSPDNGAAADVQTSPYQPGLGGPGLTAENVDPSAPGINTQTPPISTNYPPSAPGLMPVASATPATPATSVVAPPVAGIAQNGLNQAENSPNSAQNANIDAPSDKTDKTPAASSVTPSQPAPGVASAGAPSTPAGPQTPTDKVGFGLFSNPSIMRNKAFLDEAAQVFLKNKMPEGVKWLERGFHAEQENGLTAMRMLIAGDAKGAVETFNAGGQMKVTDLQPAANGQWTATLADGKQQTFDPKQMLRSFIDPKTALNMDIEDRKAAQADKELQIKGAESKARTEYMGAHTDEAKSRAELNRATAGLRDRQPAAGVGKTGKKDLPDAKELEVVHKDIRSLAQDLAGEVNPQDGKRQQSPKSIELGRTAIRLFQGSIADGANGLDANTSVTIARDGTVGYDMQKQTDGRVMAYPGVKYEGNFYPFGDGGWKDVTKQYNAAQAKKIAPTTDKFGGKTQTQPRTPVSKPIVRPGLQAAASPGYADGGIVREEPREQPRPTDLSTGQPATRPPSGSNVIDPYQMTAPPPSAGLRNASYSRAGTRNEGIHPERD